MAREHPNHGGGSRSRTVAWLLPRHRRRLLACLALVLCVAASHPPRVAAQPVAPWITERFAIIAEAAARFSVPADLIVEVIRAESGGQVRAVSSAGAVGLMQVMPSTYVELRSRHGLGADPFDVRDNVLAGTAYLRELLDRFGLPGAIAAYHAGPGRYADYLATGRPLPPETLPHVHRIARRLAGHEPFAVPHPDLTPSRPWTHAGLFVVLAADRPVDRRGALGGTSADAPDARHRQPGSMFPARRAPDLR
jgi:hypothetical protein